MWQAIDAAPYRGSRIEFSTRFQGRAFLGQFFLRALRSTDTELVLIDYTRPNETPQNFIWNRSVDTWMRAAIVHAVPAEADVILFGMATYRGGHAWVDGAQLAKVTDDTPLTNLPLEGGRIIMPLANVGVFALPTNLDFEATNLEPGGLPSDLAGC
jgi:hypothetical protein